MLKSNRTACHVQDRKRRKEQRRGQKWEDILSHVGVVSSAQDDEGDHSKKSRVLKQLLKRGLSSELRLKAPRARDIVKKKYRAITIWGNNYMGQ